MILCTVLAAAMAYGEMPMTNIVVRVGTNVLTKAAIERRMGGIADTNLAAIARGRFVDGFLKWRALEDAGGRSNVLSAIKVKITEQDVETCISNAVAYNVKARAAKQEKFLLATNIWGKAVKGASMDALSKRYGEDDFAKQTSVWGEFTADDLKAFEIDKIVIGKAEGTVFPPMEMDNCLAVMRLSEITGEDDERRYEIQRVALRLPLMAEIQSRAEIRKDLEEAERRERFKERLGELIEAQKVEYPYGLDFIIPPGGTIR